MKRSIILPGQKTPGWPKANKQVRPLPTGELVDILDTKWREDTHFVQYAVIDAIGAFRYNNEIFAAPEFEGHHIDIICVAFDIDSPAKKSQEPGAIDHWFEAERPKILRLQQAFPGGMVWRTKGGWRGCWYCERRIGSTIDTASWRKDYLAAIVFLEREFGIIADSACNDWNRLHRVPFGIRDTEASFGWGEPETRETIGRLEVGKTIELSQLATEKDRTEARRRYLSAWKEAPQSRKKSIARADEPGGVLLSGQGVWERALSRRGLIISELQPGKWAIPCPNVASHTTAGNETSTVLYAPGPGEILGHPYCSHHHCQQLDFQSSYGIPNEEWNQLIREVTSEATGPVVTEVVQKKTEDDLAREVISTLTQAKNGIDIEGCAQNVVRILVNHPYWKDSLVYDTFKHARYWRRVPPILQNIHKYDNRVLKVDAVAIQDWMLQETHTKKRISVGLDTVREAVEAASNENVVDSLREHVLAYNNQWDGTPRLDTWLIDYMGADDTPLNRSIGRKWLLAAVYRALQPGCVADMMLILEGLQGIGKGYMLKIMFEEQFLSIPYGLTVGSKDFDQKCADSWVVHDDELACSHRAGLEPTKSWLTQTTAKFRKAYSSDFIDVPRRFVQVGSTNLVKYLNDSENRRFWPVYIRKLDDTALIRDKHLIWGEAVGLCVQSYQNYRIQKGDELWGSLVAVHEDKKEADPLEEKIFDIMQSGKITAPFRIVSLFSYLGISDDKYADPRMISLVSARLHKIGYRSIYMRNGGKPCRWWVQAD